MAGLLALISDTVRAAAKSWSSRPGPLGTPAAYLPIEGAWIPCGWPLNFGQLGYDPIPGGGWDSVVYSAIMLYARTIAQLPGQHKRAREDGGEDIVTTSALSRILKKPNGYQTRSDFLLNLVAQLLWEGNSYAVALRNDRTEIDTLHPVHARCVQTLVANDGESSVFYMVSTGSNPVLDKLDLDIALQDKTRLVVPARDMLHLRQFCPRDPLVGESPLVAAALPVAIHTGGAQQYVRFAANQSRPSGVLRTDANLSADQVKALRERWEDQSKGMNSGGTPILTNGLQWQDAGKSPAEGQVTEFQKLAIADIARIFGVPLALLNDMTGSTYANTEQLNAAWLSQGLGFLVDHIELSFDQLFGLERSVDFTEFDLKALLRPDYKSQIDGLKSAVQGGILSPDEARAQVGYGRTPGGAKVRLQAQMVALDAPAAPAVPAAPAAPAPANDDEPADDASDADKADAKALAGAMLRRAIEGARAHAD